METTLQTRKEVILNIAFKRDAPVRRRFEVCLVFIFERFRLASSLGAPLTFTLTHMQTTSQPIPLVVKVLAVLMTLVVSGIGVLAFATQYAPSRSTRYGIIPALQGAQAEAFGITIFIAGLLPLALLMGSPKRAAWFGGLVAISIVASLFVDAF